MPRASRSSDTRQAILNAARKRFAMVGFRSATIRAIASDAGIDPALVMRHYGSKAELFAAAVDIDLRMPDLIDAQPEEHGRRLVEHFLARWDPSTTEGEVLLTLLRSAVTDPVLAARMRDLFAAQLVPALTGLVADQTEAPRRAGLVASQMLGLALTRSVLELPPVTEMRADEIATVVGATVQRYLRDPLAPA